MKKVDSGEFYNAKQDNIFSEYKSFRAEEYYSSEFGKIPKELKSFNESYNNEGVKSEKSEGEDSSDANELQRQYDKLNQSDSPEISDASAPSTGANASQAANVSQAAGTASGSAATAAGGATVGATAVAAVVIVTAAVTGGFITDFNSYIGNDMGMDYVSITVDMDELLSQADKSYGLSADNFSIELTEGGTLRKIALVEGKHSYLITGLQPEKTYTYNLICNNPSLGSNSNCYSQTFTTLNLGEPKGVFDELNNYISYDEVSKSATVFYSVYLSDYENKYADATLYLCSTAQTDLSDINHIVYSDKSPDGNNFFRGEAEGITCGELYMYIVGERATEYGAEAVELFSYQLTIDLPEEWQTAKNPAFEADESKEILTNLPDAIKVSGKLKDINEQYTYSAYVGQYNADGTAIIERQEVDLTVDAENMTYAFESAAYYGVNKYKYVIYTRDDEGNEVTVYESGEKQFTASQAFGATYTKVEPADATIEYNAGGVTITVDPAFDSEYSNYYYKLVVTNGEGEKYGEYTGTGVAVFEIADYVGLDKINFTYYDLGAFEGIEVEYDSHETAGIVGHAYIIVDESKEILSNQPDKLSVSGSISEFNGLYTYSAYVGQYNADGTAIIERQEVDLTVDAENMTYAFESAAYYGVDKYKYVIYTRDGDGNEVTVYESGEKQFTASQAFGATYTKVEPADATIEYNAGGVTITVDPAFDSEYSNYSYKLIVTNGEGEKYGEYTGTGVAVFEIADVTGLDEINFTYYDLGAFEETDVEYDSHETEGVAFCVPTVSLGAEHDFNGQYFTVAYACDMIYDYADASIEIEVSDGVNAYTKRVDGVSEKGIITLDNIEGEVGNVTVTATLNFKDNQSDGAVRSLMLAQAEYAMNYSFEVTKVTADFSGYSTENMLITLDFDYLLPEGYKIKISDQDNSLDKTIDLTRQYSFSDLTTDAEANLTVQVTDGDGNARGEPKTVNISLSAAEAEYDSPVMSCPNPGDAVVTYNDDGTINIYRQMIPDAYGRDTVSDDERLYYNAFVQGYYLNSDGVVYTDGYDAVGRGKYAIIENIPNQNYILIYYMMFDYNGVSYVMSAETPSGSVENVYECGTATATVADGQTTIEVSISKYGKLANKVIVDGVEYEYDFYSDESATDLTLVIDGEIEVSEITILFTAQGYKYDAYGASGEITMKGSKYGEHRITVTTEYA
ncbi:MAG: hypothetical protein ACI4L9_02520 [Candidatus Coproplasma sp.]